MLRHDLPLSAHGAGDKGALAWLTANRLWVIPLLSALFVVCIEVLAGLLGRHLPVEAHAVLGAFWIFTVGRTGSREVTMRRRGARLVGIARRQGIAPVVVRDELALLEALLEQRAIESTTGRSKNHGR